MFLAVQPYVNGDADPTARVDLTKLKVRHGGLYLILNSYMQQNPCEGFIYNLLNAQQEKRRPNLYSLNLEFFQL